jgi:hypothetical protein
MTVEWLAKRRLGVACFLVLSPSSRGCRNSTKAHAAQTKCYASNLSLPRECRYTLAASLPVASPLSRALYGTRMRPMLRTLRSSLSDRSLAWLAVLAFAPFLLTIASSIFANVRVSRLPVPGVFRSAGGVPSFVAGTIDACRRPSSTLLRGGGVAAIAACRSTR